jgi:hypothetical protein
VAAAAALAPRAHALTQVARRSASDAAGGSPLAGEGSSASGSPLASGRSYLQAATGTWRR